MFRFWPSLCHYKVLFLLIGVGDIEKMITFALWSDPVIGRGHLTELIRYGQQEFQPR